MKQLFLTICWAAGCVWQPAVVAQSVLNPTQTEQTILKNLPSSERRVDTLNEWSYNKRGAAARQYASAALDLATREGYSAGRGTSLVRLGQAAYSEGDWASAERFFQLGLRVRDSLSDRPGTAACYNLLGNVQKKVGQFDSAILLYKKGLAVLGNTPHRNALLLHNSLCLAYRHQNNSPEVLQHFSQGILVYEQMKTSGVATPNDLLNLRNDLAVLRMNMGSFLQDQLNQYPEARDSIEKSLLEFIALKDSTNMVKCLLLLGNNAYFEDNLEQARDFYEQGLAIDPKYSREDYFKLLKNRGRVLLDLGQYEKSLGDFKTSLEGFTEQGNTQEIAATYFEIGNYHYERSEMEQATGQYRQSLKVNPDNVMLKARVLYFLSDALDHMGLKEEAKRYTNDYFQVLDSLRAQGAEGQFKELLRHQIVKNRLLKNIAFQAKQAAELKLLFAVCSMALVGLCSFLLFYNQRQKRRLAERNAELARQQATLSQQKEEIAHQNEQIAIAEKLDLLKTWELETHYARLEGQDETQRRIGQELHDSVGAMLTSVKLNLSPVDEVLDRLPEDKRQQYATANRLLGEASAEVRRISHELSSAVLQKFGLLAQLEALAEAIPGSGNLQVELATHGLKERLPAHTELNIYRMVQELVHNVIKHAHASNISIEVNRFEDRINVIVADDGRGFDPKEVRQNPGLGMQSLKARVHDLNGEWQIDSRPGHGTTVSIDIPVNQTFV